MSTFKALRNLLGLTQEEMGEAIGKSQSNVSFYENGQTLPPETAKAVLVFARSRGYELTLDQIYGLAPLPSPAATEIVAAKAA